MVNLPYIRNFVDKVEIRKSTQQFLADCTNNLRLQQPARFMFWLKEKKNNIYMKSENENETEMIPELLIDIGDIICK